MFNQSRGRIRLIGWDSVASFHIGGTLLAQIIDGQAGGDHPKPARHRAAPVTTELSKLFAAIAKQRNEKFLSQVRRHIIAPVGVMKRKRFPDRVIDESRILLNKGVPSRFVAAQAARQKCLVLIGHKPVAN